MAVDSRSGKGRVLRILFLAGLAFNVVWLGVAPAAGLFREHLFLESDTLREMAHEYYRVRQPRRFINIALYDLYDSAGLTTSSEILSYLQYELDSPGSIRLVDDPAELVPEWPPGTIETYTIGSNLRVVGFLAPDDGEAEWDRVVAYWEGERVLFVPVAEGQK